MKTYEYKKRQVGGRRGSHSFTRPLRGRDEELTWLVALLQRGGGEVALVEGPRGIGKSRLLAETGRIAARHNTKVLFGKTDQLLRLVPLAPVLAALGYPPITSSLKAPDVDRDESYLRLIGRVRDQLDERASHTPILVAIDNLQCADSVTLLALRLLPEQLVGRRITWVLARRCGEEEPAVSELFSSLVTTVGATYLRLNPLSPDAVDELTADLLGAPPDPEVRAITEAADGNPYVLTELIEGLREENSIRVIDGTARLVGNEISRTELHPGSASVRLPGRYRTLMARQLAAVESQTCQLVEIAAVLGATFTPDDIAKMIDVPVATLLPSLERALSARLFICTAEAMSFRHEIVRHGILQSIPVPLRKALHWQAAQLVLRRGGSSADAAIHLAYGARKGDRAAVEVLRRTAEEIVGSSAHLAAELACRALEIMEPKDPARVPVATTAVGALVQVGPLSRAICLAQDVLSKTQPDSAAVVALRCSLATALLLGGSLTEAVSVAGELASGPCSSDEVSEHVEHVILLSLSLADPPAARDRAQAILDSPVSSPCLRVGALMALARQHWAQGRLTDGLNLVREAVARVDNRRPAMWYDPPRLLLAAMLTELCEPDEARDALEAARKELLLFGAHVLDGVPSLILSRLELSTGRLEEAVAAAKKGLARAKESGAAAQVPTAWRTLATAALRRGDLAEAVEHTERLREMALAERDQHSVTNMWLQAQIAAAGGNHVVAAQAVMAVCPDPAGLPIASPDDPVAGAWLVRVALRNGFHERAAALVDTIERFAADNPGIVRLEAAALHARGLCESAVGVLKKAVERHRDVWASGSAAEDLAAVLADTNRNEAVRYLDHALSVYHSSGAKRDAARVRHRLRDLGVRRRHWTYAKRPASGWNSLTETERCVAELVTAGLTNKQAASRMYLSPHTIGFHLRQIFQKLNIRSRVELACYSQAARGEATRGRPVA